MCKVKFKVEGIPKLGAQDQAIVEFGAKAWLGGSKVMFESP